jgi:stage IV sporulation protein FB
MRIRLSIPCGTLLGAQLRIHPLLLLMIALAVWLGILPYYLMVFSLVLAHEVCHSLAARALGVEVTEIELAPFGGVARMGAEMEVMPMREILIALAGPALNILLVLLASFIDRFGWFSSQAMASFIGANFVLAFFNMLPALPLDGGRVLRAALAMPLGLSRATKITAAAGFLLGLALVGLGVWGAVNGLINVTIFVSGLMMCMMAARENRSGASLSLRDVTARGRALARDGALPVRTLAMPAGATVASAVRRFRPRSYHRVVLLDDALRVRGEVGEEEIVRAMLDSRTTQRLSELARRRQ